MTDATTRPEKLAWIASLIGLFFLVTAVLLSKVVTCSACVPVVLASGALCLAAVVSAGRLRLARRQAEEALESVEHGRVHAGTELFDEGDDAVKLAARASEHYVKYLVPAFTVLLGVALVASGVVVWSKWNSALTLPVAERPLPYASMAFTFFLAAVISGSYFVGVSRERDCRWIRPCGALMFLNGLLFLLAGIALVGEGVLDSPATVDPRFAKVAMGLLIVLGAELITNFIIEFYRPRSPGEEERPLYESRLLALFTEPGGLARNVAASLDYQFGFQVSEVWFYRFLERTVVPFAIVMAAALWLQTCLIVVNTEENGIRERFGRVVSREPLTPGLHFKLPAPLARIYKFPVERVQEIPIGYIPEGHEGEGEDEHAEELDPEMGEMQGDPTGRVVVWTKTHHKKEFDFVVASAPTYTMDEGETGIESTEPLPVSVYFLSASIPLYFKVSNLYDYAYGHRDALATLKRVATREVVRYLANVDFFDILTTGRARSSGILQRRIQDAADELKLGVQVVFIGLQGLHPPVKVGEAFDEVVAAMEERDEKVMNAEQYAIETVLGAHAEKVGVLSDAAAYRNGRVRVSGAEAERFDKQLAAFDAAPKLFVLRSFLDVLEREGMLVRKFVVGTKEGTEVYEIDLQKKLRPDLRDLDLDRTEL